jgi:hypothetical protein
MDKRKRGKINLSVKTVVTVRPTCDKGAAKVLRVKKFT